MDDAPGHCAWLRRSNPRRQIHDVFAAVAAQIADVQFVVCR